MNKYNNVFTIIDNIKFSSKKEAKRYVDLKLLEVSGQIKELQLQKRYKIPLNDILICTYVADFYYKDKYGKEFVEDAKGFLTPIYKLKKKLMKAVHGIDILET